MKNLNDLGIQEMDAKEMKTIDGGYESYVHFVAWIAAEYSDLISASSTGGIFSDWSAE